MGRARKADAQRKPNTIATRDGAKYDFDHRASRGLSDVFPRAAWRVTIAVLASSERLASICEGDRQ